jgi:hypothetical protein
MVVFATAYRFWGPMRSLVSMAAFAPLLFAAVFLVKVDPGRLSTSSPADVVAPEVSAKTPVVLILFDEFALSSLLTDSDKLDAVRYPHFAALARTSTWYRSATTVYDVTDRAVPAVLTGRFGEPGALPIVADHPRNLFTLLGNSYGINAVQAEARLCPTNLCPHASPSLGARLRHVVSDVGKSSVLRKPAWVGDWMTPADEVAAFLGKLGKRDPQLDVMHVLLPHVPYRYLPSGRAYEDPHALPGYGAGYRWSNVAWYVDHNYERYLLQLGYTDQVLGEAMAKLRSRDVWDRALVIVTADHGVSFQTGGHRRYVDARNIGDIAPIPLFVKFPGQRQAQVDRLEARSIDIVPTIADVLGVDVPWRLDGKSLRDRARRPPSKVVVHGYRGDTVAAAWSTVESRQRETVRWKTRLFGFGTDSIFAEGGDRGLIGREVADLPQWRAHAIRARVELPASVDFDPRSAIAPSRVTGTLQGLPAGLPPSLAIAVNGRVVAVTQVLREGGSASFSAFVPDAAFRPGPNDLTVLAVRSDASGSLAVARIGAKGPDHQLAAGD